jgi:hypothetical protein
MSKLTTIVALAWMMVGSTALVKADDTPLGKEMGAMNDAFKALSKETDPVKGAALAREAAEASLKGIPLTPEFITDMIPDPKEKAKAVADYRKMMAQALTIQNFIWLFSDMQPARSLPCQILNQ